MLGVSGCSNDMRTLVEAAAEKATSAPNWRSISFATASRNTSAHILPRWGTSMRSSSRAASAKMRRSFAKRSCDGLEELGIQLDPQRNNAASHDERRIELPGGRVAVLVIPTDEEGAIAADTYQLATTGTMTNDE